MNGLRAKLRDATADLHAAVESAFTLDGPIVEPASRDLLLRTMRAAHRRFAVTLDRAASLVGLPARSARILELLDEVPEAGPEVTRAPPALHGAAAIGVLYVFEGSALGATTLVRQFTAAGRPVPAYLALLAEEAPRRWPVVVRSLAGFEERSDEVVRGARVTFGWLADHLVTAPHSGPAVAR